MVKIVNCSYESFMHEIQDKKLFLYGAGNRLKRIYDDFELCGRVKAIIDKQSKGDKFQGKDEVIPIITLKEFEESENINKSSVLIVPTYVYMEIVEELDQSPRLDGLRCYIANLIYDFYEKQDFEFTQGETLIPKKIHYCWFGQGEMPDSFKRYMESWYQFCPDYEIIRWDESNYDISLNRYMRESYECKKWGYVADCARLDIIYREGGIYLDTDVELLASIDVLLNDEMYCHFHGKFEINFGLGFGAVKGHDLIKKMRDYYDGKSFYNKEGTMNLMPCMVYQNPIMEEYGFKLEKNEYQKIGSVVVYPTEVANPKGRSGALDNFTSKTLSIHHASSTHRNESERLKYAYGKEALRRRING